MDGIKRKIASLRSELSKAGVTLINQKVGELINEIPDKPGMPTKLLMVILILTIIEKLEQFYRADARREKIKNLNDDVHDMVYTMLVPDADVKTIVTNVFENIVGVVGQLVISENVPDMVTSIVKSIDVVIKQVKKIESGTPVVLGDKEEARKADEAARRTAVEARKAEEVRKAEEAMKAEEAKKAEEARKAEEVRKAEEAKKEEARKAEEVRKAAEEARKAEEAAKKAAEEARTTKTTASDEAAKKATVQSSTPTKINCGNTGALGIDKSLPVPVIKLACDIAKGHDILPQLVQFFMTFYPGVQDIKNMKKLDNLETKHIKFLFEEKNEQQNITNDTANFFRELGEIYYSNPNDAIIKLLTNIIPEIPKNKFSGDVTVTIGSNDCQRTGIQFTSDIFTQIFETGKKGYECNNFLGGFEQKSSKSTNSIDEMIEKNTIKYNKMVENLGSFFQLAYGEKFGKNFSDNSTIKIDNDSYVFEGGVLSAVSTRSLIRYGMYVDQHLNKDFKKYAKIIPKIKPFSGKLEFYGANGIINTRNQNFTENFFVQLYLYGPDIVDWEQVGTQMGEDIAKRYI